MIWASESEDDTPVTVCLVHARFVPCRRDGEHRYSSEPEDITAVSAYQQNEIGQAEVSLLAESLRQMHRGEGREA